MVDETADDVNDMHHGWTRVGDAVRERRNHLRISQGAGGVSAATWRKIEKAIDPPYRQSTVLAVCRTLGWSPDSFDRILGGLDPIVTRPAEAASRESQLEERVAALESEVGWIKMELAALEVPPRPDAPAQPDQDDRGTGR